MTKEQLEMLEVVPAVLRTLLTENEKLASELSELRNSRRMDSVLNDLKSRGVTDLDSIQDVLKEASDSGTFDVVQRALQSVAPAPSMRLGTASNYVDPADRMDPIDRVLFDI